LRHVSRRRNADGLLEPALETDDRHAGVARQVRDAKRLRHALRDERQNVRGPLRRVVPWIPPRTQTRFDQERRAERMQPQGVHGVIIAQAFPAPGDA
jgi:hypothetical protein